jgi:heat-inducible transcriptional repressor
MKVQNLDARCNHLFKVLVELHIRDGEPIGSRTLARESSLDLSAATVRNILADLEEMGLVEAPHTSAGRVPTTKGYRYFIDTLLDVAPRAQDEMRLLMDHRLSAVADKDLAALLTEMSAALSRATKMVALVTRPKREHAAIRHVEFLNLSENRVLAILVYGNYDVENRILSVDHAFSDAELEWAGNYLSETFRGCDLLTARHRLLDELDKTRSMLNHWMRVSVGMATALLAGDDEEETECVIAGEWHLLSCKELQDVAKLEELFRALDAKHELLHLLEQCIAAGKMQIFIGGELELTSYEDLSMVSAPYQVQGRTVGVLAALGPRRMPYERVIPTVNLGAQLLGAILNCRH